MACNQAAVLSRYLPDIIAALLQLTQREKDDSGPWLEHSRKLLEGLLMTAHPLVLMEAFTALLTVRGRPPWLAKRCSTLLSTVTLRPGGVQAVLSLMLDQEKAHAPVTAQAVKLLSTVPKQCTVKEYIGKLAPQLTALLQCTVHNVRKEVCRVGGSTVG